MMKEYATYAFSDSRDVSALTLVCSLPMAAIEKRRKEVFDNVINDVETRTRRTIVRQLEERCIFDREELQQFYGSPFEVRVWSWS